MTFDLEHRVLRLENFLIAQNEQKLEVLYDLHRYDSVSVRAINCLVRADIRTFAALREVMETPSGSFIGFHISDIKGLGKMGIDEIQNAWDAYEKRKLEFLEEI